MKITTNAGVVAADIAAEGPECLARVQAVVIEYGAILQGNIKRRAKAPRTGPVGPEPRLVHGNYNGSINLRNIRTSTGATAEVGTNAPQGRRLELGFSGVDSLGRHYNDPARPHFGPGLDETAIPFRAAVAEAALPPGVGL